MQIDEFVELARKRRSIRRFKPDPVPDEYIEKILEAARWAMSGSNGQPWEFIVVRDEETKNRIAETMVERGKLTTAMEGSRVKEMRHVASSYTQTSASGTEFGSAPVLIVVCADPRTAQVSQLGRLCDRRWVIDENIATASQIIHLAAVACGLGSRWITIAQWTEEVIKPILGIPPIIKIFNIAAIGYPAHEPKLAYRRELREIVHYDRYDMSKHRSHEQVQDFVRYLRELSLQRRTLK